MIHCRIRTGRLQQEATLEPYNNTKPQITGCTRKGIKRSLYEQSTLIRGSAIVLGVNVCLGSFGVLEVDKTLLRQKILIKAMMTLPVAPATL